MGLVKRGTTWWMSFTYQGQQVGTRQWCKRSEGPRLGRCAARAHIYAHLLTVRLACVRAHWEGFESVQRVVRLE